MSPESIRTGKLTVNSRLQLPSTAQHSIVQIQLIRRDVELLPCHLKHSGVFFRALTILLTHLYSSTNWMVP